MVHEDAPIDLPDEHVAAAIEAWWLEDFEGFRYLRVGGGGYHWNVRSSRSTMFVTVDDLDTKDWLGDDRNSRFEGLSVTLEGAAELREKHGLDFVVAPVRSVGGAAVVRLDDRYAISLYPFLEATAGIFGGHPCPVRRDVLTMLARLHATPAPSGARYYDQLRIGMRSELDGFLAEPTQVWSKTPEVEAAQMVLSHHIDQLRDRLEQFDEATQVANQATDVVLTHGEPHPANMLFGNGSPALVDWDTLGISSPERDLWFVESDDDALAFYTEATGHEPDRALMALYRLRWRWDDLAHLTACLSAPAESPVIRRYVDAIPPLLADLLA